MGIRRHQDLDVAALKSPRVEYNGTVRPLPPAPLFGGGRKSAGPLSGAHRVPSNP